MLGSTLEVAELLNTDSHLVEPLVDESSLLPPELKFPPKQIGGSLNTGSSMLVAVAPDGSYETATQSPWLLFYSLMSI